MITNICYQDANTYFNFNSLTMHSQPRNIEGQRTYYVYVDITYRQTACIIDQVVQNRATHCTWQNNMTFRTRFRLFVSILILDQGTFTTSHVILLILHMLIMNVQFKCGDENLKQENINRERKQVKKRNLIYQAYGTWSFFRIQTSRNPSGQSIYHIVLTACPEYKTKIN